MNCIQSIRNQPKKDWPCPLISLDVVVWRCWRVAQFLTFESKWFTPRFCVHFVPKWTRVSPDKARTSSRRQVFRRQVHENAGRKKRKRNCPERSACSLSIPIFGILPPGVVAPPGLPPFRCRAGLAYEAVRSGPASHPFSLAFSSLFKRHWWSHGLPPGPVK